MLDVVRVVLVVLRTSSMWWVEASSLGMCLAAGAGAAACACACSIRDMERKLGEGDGGALAESPRAGGGPVGGALRP